jgi:SGNH hydrolase-like domain, acetyltransferase AlgX
MSDTPAPIPPGEEFPPEQILVGRRAGWILTSVFLLLLLVPPLLDGFPGRVRELWSAVAGKGSAKPIAERLRGYDNSVAAAGFTDAPRGLMQQALTTLLGQGNHRVIIGREGWLFYRPEIQALTGYGPIEPEPHSVSRDPSLLDWEAPLEPIREFAAQLRERGVALWLVPVPMKPSIYPEKLTGKPADHPLRHRDAAAFFQKLETAGVRVIDLAPMLWAAKAADAAEGPVYLKDDTHWTTRGLTKTSDLLAEAVRRESWWTQSARAAWPVLAQSSAPGHGDLVEKLGLRHPSAWAAPRVESLQVVQPPSGALFPDPASPLVLLGDSFVNLFDDPGLGFPLPGGGTSSRAGLAWHLAGKLGSAPDVHAVNGEGASGVRRWLAQRGETVVRSKKLVIWVIAERDLFLSRSVAKANRITWDRVVVSEPASSPAGPGPSELGIVEAEAIELADIPDPRRANYENALYTVQYKVRKTLSGPAPAAAFEVVHWAFKKRELQPTARIEAGRTYRLKLDPWSTRPELQKINLSTLTGAAPAWWAEEAVAVEP